MPVKELPVTGKLKKAFSASDPMVRGVDVGGVLLADGLNAPILNQNVLTFKYKDSDGVIQTREVDLSHLMSEPEPETFKVFSQFYNSNNIINDDATLRQTITANISSNRTEKTYLSLQTPGLFTFNPNLPLGNIYPFVLIDSRLVDNIRFLSQNLIKDPYWIEGNDTVDIAGVDYNLFIRKSVIPSNSMTEILIQNFN